MMVCFYCGEVGLADLCRIGMSEGTRTGEDGGRPVGFLNRAGLAAATFLTTTDCVAYFATTKGKRAMPQGFAVLDRAALASQVSRIASTSPINYTVQSKEVNV